MQKCKSKKVRVKRKAEDALMPWFHCTCLYSMCVFFLLFFLYRGTSRLHKNSSPKHLFLSLKLYGIGFLRRSILPSPTASICALVLKSAGSLNRIVTVKRCFTVAPPSYWRRCPENSTVYTALKVKAILLAIIEMAWAYYTANGWALPLLQLQPFRSQSKKKFFSWAW